MKLVKSRIQNRPRLIFSLSGYILLTVFVCGIISCTTLPVYPPEYVLDEPQDDLSWMEIEEDKPPQVDVRPAHIFRKDVVHEVAPGETIWRLAKTYNVKAQDIRRKNNLSVNQDIQMGQELIIPGAARPQDVIPLFPSAKWQYIIVHHSATDEGNSLMIDKLHIRRGWDGAGYHFIIDNGTKGKRDGQIEATPRWLKQKDGAHCKASNMNVKGIGVCLIGNFDHEKVSPRQMASLVMLVNKLRKYYNIPVSRIIGHGQVEDAATHCPGTGFPWDQFIKRLQYSF